MAPPFMRPTSLYDLLSEPAPAGAAAGETITTRQKETLDNDTEAFEFEHHPGFERGN